MTPSDVTTDWVESLSLAVGRVISVTVEPISVGVGLLTTVVRSRLQWEPAHAGPASVIVKMPSADPGNRSIVAWFGYDEREAGAYRDLGVGDGRRAPNLLASTPTALVLEDLDTHRTADQLRGATPADAVAVAEALARIHASWWADTALATHPWLPGPTDPAIAGYGEMLDHTWGHFVDRTRSWMTAQQRAAAERARARFDEAITSVAQGPLTLVHGDARLDNWMFAADGGATAVDWQLAARGNGAYDLAFFAAGSLNAPTREASGPGLLNRYRAVLTSHGVSLSAGDLEERYRLGHVQNLPNPVTALVAVNPGNERGRQLLEINARRALDSLVELGF